MQLVSGVATGSRLCFHLQQIVPVWGIRSEWFIVEEWRPLVTPGLGRAWDYNLFNVLTKSLGFLSFHPLHTGFFFVLLPPSTGPRAESVEANARVQRSNCIMIEVELPLCDSAYRE